MSNEEPMRNINPFGLRLQPDLKARLEEAAKLNKRSLNAEIAARLEDSFSGSSEHRLSFTIDRDKLNDQYVHQLKGSTGEQILALFARAVALYESAESETESESDAVSHEEPVRRLSVRRKKTFVRRDSKD